MKVLLAKGIFMWDAPERREQRYGWFFAGRETFDDKVHFPYTFNDKEAESLQHKKVKITVKVVESRKSGHAGDQFIDMMPSTPTIGEEIALGVGIFNIRRNAWIAGLMDMALVPKDNRGKYWIDPNLLYRLHDQTVEVYGEETEEPFHEAPKIVPVRKAGAISNGDGTFQIVGINPEDGAKIKVLPQVERLGKGLFQMTPPSSDSKKGEVFDVE